jgi:hypothetical protein
MRRHPVQALLLFFALLPSAWPWMLAPTRRQNLKSIMFCPLPIKGLATTKPAAAA